MGSEHATKVLMLLTHSQRKDCGMFNAEKTSKITMLNIGLQVQSGIRKDFSTRGSRISGTPMFWNVTSSRPTTGTELNVHLCAVLVRTS